MAPADTLFQAVIQERDKRIFQLARQGLTHQQISKRLSRARSLDRVSCSRRTVDNVISAKRHLLSSEPELVKKSKKPKKVSATVQAQVDEVRRLTKSGLNGYAIAKKMGLSPKTLRSKAAIGGFKLKWPSKDERDGLPTNVDDVVVEWYTKDKLDQDEIGEKLGKVYGEPAKRCGEWVLQRLRKRNATRTNAEARLLRDGFTSHNRIDLDPKVEQGIVDLYKQGYGEPSIIKKLQLKHPHVIERVLRDNGVEKRDRKAAVHATPARTDIHRFTEEEELAICKGYESGVAMETLAEQRGTSYHVIRRVLVNRNVRIRTMKEAQQLRARRGRDCKWREKFKEIEDRFLGEEDAIKQSIRVVVARKFSWLMSEGDNLEEVVGQAFGHSPRIATRWKKSGYGDNFLWYVGYYSVLSLIDERRRMYRQREKHGEKVVSLDDPNMVKSSRSSDGTTLSRTVADPKGQPSYDRLEWEDSKAALLKEARRLVYVEAMPSICLDLLHDYLLPIAENGVPKMTMKRLGERRGLSESYVSQMSRHDELVGLVGAVFRRDAA